MKRVQSVLSSDSEKEDDPSPGGTSPKRNTNPRSFAGAAKYKTRFNVAWQVKYPVSAVADDPSGSAFRCDVCARTLSCGHQGEADIKRHVDSDAHKKFMKSSRNQPKISDVFSRPKDDRTMEKVSSLMFMYCSYKLLFTGIS